MYLREHWSVRLCSFLHLLLRDHREEVWGGLDRPAMIELQCQYDKMRWVETATKVKAEDMAITNLIDKGVQVRRHQR